MLIPSLREKFCSSESREGTLLNILNLVHINDHAVWGERCYRPIGEGPGKVHWCGWPVGSLEWLALNVACYYVQEGVVCASRRCNMRDECPHGVPHRINTGQRCLKGDICYRLDLWTDNMSCLEWSYRFCDEYQGWSNSATYLFALYFGQEQRLVNELMGLRRGSDNKVHPNKAYKLFTRALADERMCQLDEWAEGPVCILEVLENFGV